jgi:hypothetical protein
MEDQVSNIENIENMREILHKLATTKGLDHPDVLAASKVLDQEISSYLRNKGKVSSGDVSHNNYHSEKL